MKKFVFTLALIAASAAAHAQPLSDPALEAKAQAINDRVMALDTHVDIPVDFATATMDPGGFTTDQVDLPKMRAGGLDAAFFIVYTPQGPLTAAGYADAKKYALNKLEAIHRLAQAYPDQIGLALSSKDARAIALSGRKIAFIGMENPYPLGESVADVPKWAQAGVRYMGITHFGNNQFGDSANPAEGEAAERYGGLSDLGRELIPALNKAGIMVDVSHASRKTMMQAVALSKAPIIASHSGVAALADNPRNLDDEQLRAIAKNGGVVQIVAVGVYVKPLNEAQKALQEKIRKEMHLETDAARSAMSKETEAEYNKRLEAMWAISPRASVSDLVDAIDHAVNVAGIDHVGIASDFDGGGGIDGWDDASETINMTRELVKRGYSEEDIAKIWGGNLLRVLDEVQKTAREIKD
ncbi:MAG TPA: dipeptidase [Parvularculaceae bacterium]|nr:dipeptidase [Parvularculaceae bacterium]